MEDKEREELRLRKEWMLRGRIIKSTALIEMIVARIMLVSNFPNPDLSYMVELKGVTITKKLGIASKLLRELHPLLFPKFNKIKRRFNKLKDFRNQLSHCVFVWHDPELMSFKMWDTFEGEDGLHYFKLVEVSIEECIKKIFQFDKVSNDFLDFVIELEESLGQPFQDFLQRPIPPKPQPMHRSKAVKKR